MSISYSQAAEQIYRTNTCSIENTCARIQIKRSENENWTRQYKYLGIFRKFLSDVCWCVYTSFDLIHLIRNRHIYFNQTIETFISPTLSQTLRTLSPTEHRCHPYSRKQILSIFVLKQLIMLGSRPSTVTNSQGNGRTPRCVRHAWKDASQSIYSYQYTFDRV